MLGSGRSLVDDIDAACRLVDPNRCTVLAVNDAGCVWPLRLDHWCTLHPEKLLAWEGRRPGPRTWTRWAHTRHGFPFVDRATDHWHGSSGLFALKIALEDLGHRKAILAGVPMDGGPHFFDAARWDERNHFTAAWKMRADQIRPRVRSFSGWTRELLGEPSRDWLAS